MGERWMGFLAALTLFGCMTDAEQPGSRASAGPTVGVSVAALNLQGVGDVVWDVEVVNGRTPTADVVWQRRISSSAYGDGAGSASYVGPCDADPAVSLNVVRVWVVGVYSGPVTSLGAFAAGGAGGADGPTVAFQNPTATAPLTRAVTCQQNVDAAVQFDVALMRPAQQGFFDIALNFNNIFCSAKFDCCEDGDNDGACDADLALLFEPGGGRGPTMVLGFACTAGPRAGVETELYLDALELDCTSPTDFTTGFGADITVDPARTPGNQCVAGQVGAGQCAAVTGAAADTYLYQVAVYRGVEALTSAGVDAHKTYWNVALGVKKASIGACWLRTRGTADDALGSAVVDNGAIAAGAVYPYVQWEVELGSCASEALSFASPTAMVRPEYTRTGDAALAFDFGYGPGREAGSFCGAPCQNGGECVSGTCVCLAGYQGASCQTAVPPSSLSYAPSALVCDRDAACALGAPTSTGGPVTAYGISPGLPAGLTINPSTGEIAGTPTVGSGATTYTVTASNAGGSTTATVSVTVIVPCTAGYRLFTASGTFSPATEAPGCTTFRVLIVGGGAAPTNAGGGGGSGWVTYASFAGIGATTVTVGAGGAGQPSSSSASSGGHNGGQSAFGATVAAGGLNSTSPLGGNGGSGGGGASWSPTYGGGANGGTNGSNGGSSTYAGGVGQGGSFSANFAGLTQVTVSAGAGGLGHGYVGVNTLGGAGGGGGVRINGAGPSAGSGSNTAQISGTGGVGYGAGGGSGGWIAANSTYYASGSGAAGVVYVEWSP